MKEEEEREFWREGDSAYLTTEKMNLLSDLRKELVYLILIFFNLIFIHIQRSIILLAHGIEKGVSEVYFFTLFGIILILIPCYRIRAKLVIRKKGFYR